MSNLFAYQYYNSMNIAEIYEKTVYGIRWSVAKGTCDGRPTKWCTQIPLADGTISMLPSTLKTQVFMRNGDRPVLVWEDDEEEYVYF